MRKTLLFLLISCIYLPIAFTSSTYTVTKDKINVRVDSTVMSDSLGLLIKGTVLEAVEEKYDWVKIRLPQNYSCYIAKQFVERLPDNKGKVIASSLHLRDKPSLDSHSLGRIPRGSMISIIDRKKEWYKIRGYPHAHGWVHKKFLQQTDKTPSLSMEVKTLVSKLSEPDIRKKINVHNKLVEKGEIVIPLLEVYLSEADKNTTYSLISILAQLGKANPRLISHFLQKAEPASIKIAGIYLDIAQDIIQPKGERKAYFYQAQLGKLTPNEINKAKRLLQKIYIESYN